MNKTDGIKFTWKDKWVHLRKSNTEPILRIYAEAPNSRKAKELIDKIKKSVAASHNQNVLNNIGGFAGMYELDKDIDNPVLVACTDGVGTKVALAQEYNALNLSLIHI